MVPWEFGFWYNISAISRYLKHCVVHCAWRPITNRPGCEQAQVVTCGPLLCCVAVLSRARHRPRYARLPNFLFYAFPDTIEYLRVPKALEDSNHRASHMWHPSATADATVSRPSASAESRNHHHHHHHHHHDATRAPVRLIYWTAPPRGVSAMWHSLAASLLVASA